LLQEYRFSRSGFLNSFAISFSSLDGKFRFETSESNVKQLIGSQLFKILVRVDDVLEVGFDLLIDHFQNALLVIVIELISHWLYSTLLGIGSTGQAQS